MDKTTELAIKLIPPILVAMWIDVKVLVMLMYVLILIDNGAALYKAWRFSKEGEKWFKYKKLRKTIDKFVWYPMAFITAWIISYMVELEFNLGRYVSGYIAIYEGISIFKHMFQITGLTLFADITDFLKEKMDIKKYFKKKKNGKEEN